MKGKRPRKRERLDIYTALIQHDPRNSTLLELEAENCARDSWWTWQEALAWVASRNRHDIATLRVWPKFYPSDVDISVITGGQYHLAREIMGGDADEIEGSLLLAIEQGRMPTKGRSAPSGAYQALEPIAWRGRAIFAFSETVELVTKGKQAEVWYHDIAVDRAALFQEFPEPTPPRPSYQDAIDWCTEWITSGNGNGVNPAWADFKAEPRHKGLSRGEVFRPAWRDAKAKISRN